MNNEVILTSRMVECSTLTPEAFAELMIEDMIKAKAVFLEQFEPLERQKYDADTVAMKARRLKMAQEEAARRWKTEKRRNTYVEEQMAKFSPWPYKPTEFDYLKMNLSPYWSFTSNGVSYNHMEREDLMKLFNEIKLEHFFNIAKGWSFKYNDDHHPSIDLILDDEAKAEWHQISINIATSITEYYDTSHYTGD